MTKTRYMHTIKDSNTLGKGSPGYYNGCQIVFAGEKGDNKVKLVNSLKQIYKERERSNTWRRKQGFEVGRYGYALVEI